MTIFELVTRVLTERKGERAERRAAVDTTRFLRGKCPCFYCRCGRGNE